MAHAISAVASHPTLAERVREFFNNYKAASARRALYRQTVSELSALSNHDLSDIGISRGQIEDIARQHAFGA